MRRLRNDLEAAQPLSTGRGVQPHPEVNRNLLIGRVGATQRRPGQRLGALCVCLPADVR